MGGFPNDLVSICDTPRLRLLWRDGPGPMLFVIFSGVGTDHGVWPGPEFVRFVRERPEHAVLFVIDGARRWLNDAEAVARVTDEVRALRAGRPDLTRVVTLGHSMGGFAAIGMSGALGAQVAIAFSPQFSVHPDIVPDERRWKRFRAGIRDWQVRDLSDRFAPATRYYLFHGGDRGERRHSMPVPVASNVQHYVFPRLSHYLVRSLREAALLHPIIARAAADQPARVRRRVERAGGLKRQHLARGEPIRHRPVAPSEERHDDQV